MWDCSVYLLAAGRGRRSGGPKAWREHDGTTLLERQLAFLLDFIDPEELAVSIQEPWLERCEALRKGVRWVQVDPDATPMSSLQALIHSGPVGRWTFVYHVDMPVWEKKLFEALYEKKGEAERAGAAALMPVFGDRGGHPILLSPDAASSLVLLDSGKDRLDHWLREKTVLRVEVPYSCARENWNGPAAGRTVRRERLRPRGRTRGRRPGRR